MTFSHVPHVLSAVRLASEGLRPVVFAYVCPGSDFLKFFFLVGDVICSLSEHTKSALAGCLCHRICQVECRWRMK